MLFDYVCFGKSAVEDCLVGQIQDGGCGQFREGRWFSGGNQNHMSLFMFIDADSRWGFGVEGGGEHFPWNLFLELKTKWKGIIFSLLNLFYFVLCPGFRINPQKGHMRCYRMKRNAMKSNSINVTSLRLDFSEGQSNMFSVTAGEFLVSGIRRPGVWGSEWSQKPWKLFSFGSLPFVHHGFFLEFLLQTFLGSYWEKRGMRDF